MEMVVGFLFSEERDKVVLIKKTHPEWQKGKLNGVGGKVQPGETPYAAMVREFKEEAGLNITGWRRFCILHGSARSTKMDPWVVHFFVDFAERPESVVSMTDETVLAWDYPDVITEEFGFPPHIPNLHWLLPMAEDPDNLLSVVVEDGLDTKHIMELLSKNPNY